jgi:hypothetical protein
VANEYPRSAFFAGKLVFANELDGFVSRFLHNHTALELRVHLQAQGLSLVILPVRVMPSRGRPFAIPRPATSLPRAGA